jgi:acetyl esterase
MELDDRMTDETKQALIAICQFASSLYSCNDIPLIRKQTDLMDDEQNKMVQFDGLTYEEHLVKSMTDDYQIPVTAYIPKAKNANTKIVVFFHGGAFKWFSRKSYYRTVGHIAEKTNTIWVSVEYRLIPEFKCPVGIHDCLSVTQWVLDNKKNLFGSDDCAPVGVCGDSAGGNLAACVVHAFRNKLAFQILVYPWLDLTYSSESIRSLNKPCFFVTFDDIKKGAAEYLDNMDASSASVSPMFNNDFTGIPRSLIVNAELDPLVDEGRIYFEKLQSAGIPSERVVLKGAIHGFFSSFPFYMNTFYEGAGHVINFLNAH